jgi:hypothetical protein
MEGVISYKIIVGFLFSFGFKEDSLVGGIHSAFPF